MARLIFSGIFDKLPRIKIITHHMGGMIPYFANKIALGFEQIFADKDTNPVAVRAGLKRHQPLDYYHMLYGDTALNGSLPSTQCGLAFFGVEHSLFASDAPFDFENGAWLIGGTIKALDALDIPKKDREAIYEKNARRLLKLD
jgi:aminocarboxymuconate-semialdehyde decarboxylase